MWGSQGFTVVYILDCSGDTYSAPNNPLGFDTATGAPAVQTGATNLKVSIKYIHVLGYVYSMLHYDRGVNHTRLVYYIRRRGHSAIL